MGDVMFNVGDFVTRKKYNNDIVFKIISINNDIYYLKGVYVRLYADSYEDDLVLHTDDELSDSFHPDILEYRDLNRSDFFY